MEYLTDYEPSWRDRLANTMLGDDPSYVRKRFVEGLLGSRGMGPTGMGVVDATPIGGLLAAQEAARGGDYRGAAMAVMPMGGVLNREAKALGREVQTGIRAYHGSPYDFDRFDLSKIGTGEGNQAYGHGGYFADLELLAKRYRDETSRARGVDKGTMYEVNIKADPNDLLDWDKPLSADASQVIKDAFNHVANSDPILREKFHKAFREQQPGSIYYSILSDHAKTGDSAKNQLFATNKLREAGIPGVKYLDQGSRGVGEGTRNYVVFDDSLIEILRKYGIVGLLGAGAGYGAMSSTDAQAAAK